jgi:hypothetical protein
VIRISRKTGQRRLSVCCPEMWDIIGQGVQIICTTEEIFNRRVYSTDLEVLSKNHASSASFPILECQILKNDDIFLFFASFLNILRDSFPVGMSLGRVFDFADHLSDECHNTCFIVKNTQNLRLDDIHTRYF